MCCSAFLDSPTARYGCAYGNLPITAPYMPRNKEKQQAYFQANKAEYKKRARKTKEKLMELVNAIKDAPCMDCGQKFPPYVMDFDHRDPKTKEASVSHMVGRQSSFELVVAEIEKCDLVCSNCHRIRTHKKP